MRNVLITLMSKASQKPCLRPFETLGLAEEKEKEEDEEKKKEKKKEDGEGGGSA